MLMYYTQTHTHTHRGCYVIVRTLLAKRRAVDKEGEHSDSNNFLYDDITPTPKKVTKARKVVRKSQISAPILHNSSVSSCTANNTL